MIRLSLLDLNPAQSEKLMFLVSALRPLQRLSNLNSRTPVNEAFHLFTGHLKATYSQRINLILTLLSDPLRCFVLVIHINPSSFLISANCSRSILTLNAGRHYPAVQWHCGILTQAKLIVRLELLPHLHFYFITISMIPASSYSCHY